MLAFASLLLGSMGAFLDAADEPLPLGRPFAVDLLADEAGRAGCTFTVEIPVDAYFVAGATSGVVDPVLRVDGPREETTKEDDDSGGGTAAFVVVRVRAADCLRVTVAAQPPAAGAVTLAANVFPALDESARARLMECVAGLDQAEQAATSDAVRAAKLARRALDDLLVLPAAEDRFEVAAALERTVDVATAIPDLGIPLVRVAADRLARFWSRCLPEQHPMRLKARLRQLVFESAADRVRGAFELRKVIDGLEGAVSEDDPVLLAARFSLASTLSTWGGESIEDALDEWIDLIRVYERVRPPDDPDLQHARSGLARVLLELDFHADAERVLEPTVESCRRTFGEHGAATLGAMNLLAEAKIGLGEYVQADEVLGRILDGPSGRERRIAQVRRGILRRLLGDMTEAPLEDLAADGPALGPEQSDIHLAALLLVDERERVGDLAGAARSLADLIRELEATRAPDNALLLGLRAKLAALHREAGDVDAAIVLGEAAFTGLKRTLGADHTEVLKAMAELARSLRARGEPERALDLYREAEVHVPAGHPFAVEMKENVACALAEAGRDAEARRAFEESLVALRGSLPGALAAFGSRAYALRRHMVQRLVSGVLSCRDPGVPAGKSAADELAVVVAWRGLVEAEARVQSLLHERAQHHDELRRLLDRAREARVRFSRAYAKGGPLGAELFAESRKTRKTMEAATAELVRVDPSLLATIEVGRPADLDALAARIPERAALVVTATYVERKTPRLTGESRAAEPVARRVTAFVFARDAEARRVELGLESDVARWCEAIRADLVADAFDGSTAARDVVPFTQPAYDAPDLPDRLSALLAALPRGTERLIIAPDGALAGIPWEVLRVGEEHRLGDAFFVRYVDCPRALLREDEPIAGGALVVVGDVAYDAAPSSDVDPSPAAAPIARGHVPVFSSLPGTAVEVDAVCSEFAAAHPDLPLVRFSGAGATVASFIAQAPRARFLHVATHGFVSAAERAERGVPIADRARASDHYPELLSGLALAGANQVDDAGRRAGLLSGFDLAALDLRGCELAVLSVCRSNDGPRPIGDGVAGLNRALHLAGARTTITTLYSIPDDETARFFAAFYRASWQRGLSPEEALAAARLERIGGGAPLGAVAAFVLYDAG